VSILGAKTAGIKVPANLPRRRHPSAIGQNGMRKKGTPGVLCFVFLSKIAALLRHLGRYGGYMHFPGREVKCSCLNFY
ncbi:uncharacterized protein METZ01_LOCUS199852, partial [marine metagenome]